jgi:hypothetical protein
MIVAHGGTVGAVLELSAPVLVLLALLAGPMIRRLRGTPAVRPDADEPVHGVPRD